MLFKFQKFDAVYFIDYSNYTFYMNALLMKITLMKVSNWKYKKKWQNIGTKIYTKKLLTQYIVNETSLLKVLYQLKSIY